MELHRRQRLSGASPKASLRSQQVVITRERERDRCSEGFVRERKWRESKRESGVSWFGRIKEELWKSGELGEMGGLLYYCFLDLGSQLWEATNRNVFQLNSDTQPKPKCYGTLFLPITLPEMRPKPKRPKILFDSDRVLFTPLLETKHDLRTLLCFYLVRNKQINYYNLYKYIITSSFLSVV